jgi:hypothetical protein
MKFPQCDKADCTGRFIEKVATKTCENSPFTYDRAGNIVGGGINTTTGILRCTLCEQEWTYHESDYDKATGKPRQYIKMDVKFIQYTD